MEAESPEKKNLVQRKIQMKIVQMMMMMKMIKIITHYLKEKMKKQKKLILYIIKSKINYQKFKKRIPELILFKMRKKN